MLFTNAYDRTIDAKSRLQIPTQVREIMQSAGRNNVLFLVPGARPNTLAFYLEDDFKVMAASMDPELIPDEDALTFQQMFYSMAVRLEMDKQGRVVLPERSIQRAGLGSEVVLTGAGNHLVLWNKQAYNGFMDQNWDQWQQVQRQARAAASGKAKTQ